MRDVRFGLRLLRRSPVFTLTAALLLAIGIGANTLIFSAVNALLLRPLPVPHPEDLVRLVEVHPTNFVTWQLPNGLCEALASAKPAWVSEVLCQGEADVGFSDGASTERVRVHLVSANFFSSLGVKAALGRVLTGDDERIAATNAVLSYEFWQRRFQRDPGVLGRTFALHGRPFTVVGVTARGFNGLAVDTSPDLRVPAAVGRLIVDPIGEMKPGLASPVFAEIFARLRPGVSVQSAEAEIEPLLRRRYEELLDEWFPDRKGAGSPEVAAASRLRLESIEHGISPLRTQFSRGLEVLMAAVGLLLIMACANVAGLLLARSAAREQEFGVRLALGASRGRIARQLLTESLLIALLGGCGGTLLTYACLPLLVRALPPLRDRAAVVQPLAVSIDVDGRVLGFALAATLLTAVLFGVSPALRAGRADLAATLRAARTSTGRLLGRNLVVTAQVAVCTLILVGASLLIETLQRMQVMDPGFDRDHVVTFTVDPRLRGYTAEQAKTLARALLDKARWLPMVVAASIASRGVMRGTGVKATFGAAGTRIYKNAFLNSSLNNIMPGYFETMGMRLLAGRDFTRTDGAVKTKPLRVIVNEAFVRRFFPQSNPLGQRFGFSGPDGLARPDDEIAAVVSDAKYRSLREPIPPTVYTPLVDNFEDGFILHVRTRQKPEVIIAPMRNFMRSFDAALPFIEVRTLREEVDTSLWQERLLAMLSSIFGAIAALLACIGLYGALDYAVKCRTREIGVRVALGAGPGTIARLLSRETLIVVGAGIALGVCGYAMAAQSIHQVLYGVTSWSPGALGLALLTIAVIAVLGAGPPIVRGLCISPSAALRAE